MDPTGALFALSPDIRYVAVSRAGQLQMQQRDGLAGASAPESDRYEELLVNPTLLGLAGRRGQIDCGGLDYIVLRYGSFFQLVVPVADGHVSIAFELHANPIDWVGEVAEVLQAHGLGR